VTPTDAWRRAVEKRECQKAEQKKKRPFGLYRARPAGRLGSPAQEKGHVRKGPALGEQSSILGLPSFGRSYLGHGHLYSAKKGGGAS